MSNREAELIKQTMQINRAEMIARISRAVPEDGLLEAFPGLVLGRFSRPTERVYSVFKPSFCVITQGSKEVLLGDEVFRYDPSHYLIATVDLLDAVVKLARLLDTPDKIRFLAPLIIRESIYRLLRGEQGARLSHMLVSE